MSILLIILKIIGILILAIIILTAIVLFHPVFYQVKGEVEEEWYAEGYFWWLFQILRLEFKLENDEMQWRFYIFGRSKRSDDIEWEEDSSWLYQNQEQTYNPAEREDGSGAAETAENPSFDQKDTCKTKERTPKYNDSPRREKRAVKQKNSFKSKKNTAKNKFSHWKKELTDEKNHRAVSHIWKEICCLFSHLKPKYLKAGISFSTGDPASTGYATGALALIPAIYRYDTHIYPDFMADKFYVRGSFVLKGHMAVFHFIRSMIRLILDKDTKRLYNKLRK